MLERADTAEAIALNRRASALLDQCFYAGNDARVTATVPQTTELMKKIGKEYEPKTYDGAGHGFMRAGEAPDASTANQHARDAAWRRWLELLKQI